MNMLKLDFIRFNDKKKAHKKVGHLLSNLRRNLDSISKFRQLTNKFAK